MITRRRLFGLTAGITASALLASCISQEKGEPQPAEVTILPGDVPQAGSNPLRNAPGRFYLINNGDGLLALSTRCTHQGCNVDWESDKSRFHCPCHGSTFDLNGVETGGPAPRPLDLMTVTVQADESVLIRTAPLEEREDYTPDQATPYAS